MLGIMTENTSVLNGEDSDRPNKRPKLNEDFTSPQRSILDFFKGSSKTGGTSKPKDLLGFFGKVPSKPGVSLASCNGDIHKVEDCQKENGPVAVLNSEKSKIIKKGTKRKQSVNISKDTSLEDFDVEDTGSKDHKKKLAPKKKSEQLGINDVKLCGRETKSFSQENPAALHKNEEESQSECIETEKKKEKLKMTDESEENMEKPELIEIIDSSENDSVYKNEVDLMKEDSVISDCLESNFENTVCDEESKPCQEPKICKSAGTEDEKKKDKKRKSKNDELDVSGISEVNDGLFNEGETLNRQSDSVKKKEHFSKKSKTPGKSKSIDDDAEKKKKENEYVEKLIHKMALLENKQKTKKNKLKEDKGEMGDMCNEEEKMKEKIGDKEKDDLEVMSAQQLQEEVLKLRQEVNKLRKNKQKKHKKKHFVGENFNGNSSKGDKVMEVSYNEYIQSIDNVPESVKNDFECSECPKDDIVKDQNSDKCGYKKDELDNLEYTTENAEMSYSEFLESVSCEKSCDSEKNTDSKIKTNDNIHDNVEDKSGEDKHDKTGDNDRDGDNVSDKKYPSVANFFTKISRDSQKGQNEKDENVKVIVKADVHPLPSPPESKNTEEVSVKSDRRNSPAIKRQDEIEVLGSEIIDIDDLKKSKKNKRKNVEKSSKIEKTPKKLEKTPKKKQSSTCDKIETTPKKFTSELSDKNEKKLAKKVSLSDKLNDDNDSCMCIEEIKAEIPVPYIDVEKTAFLQSTEKLSVPQKTTQATLSFGKSGLQTQKLQRVTRMRPGSKRKENAELPLSESTPIKPKTNKKSKINGSKNQKKDSAETPSKLADVTPIKKTDSKEEVDFDKSGVSEGRKSLRLKYKVALIDGDDKKGSPIRIKLRRYDKSSSIDGDTFTPKSNKKRENSKTKANTKLSKAQELLVKAKKSKQKPKTKVTKLTKKTKADCCEESKKEEVIERSGRRRSARLEQNRSKSKDEVDIVIVDDDEEEEERCDGKRKKGNKAKPTPKKGKKEGTPRKKTPKKLASIFCPKGRDKKENATVIELDPEKERLRRAFLMSGVPEELKRQTTNTSHVMLGDYPPLPTITHTQQRDLHLTGSSHFDIWNLKDVKLKFVQCKSDLLCNQNVAWSDVFMDKSVNSKGLQNIQKFTKHKLHEPEEVLKELHQFCPSYPVNNVYKLLKEKADLYTEDVTESKSKTEHSESQKQDIKLKEEKEQKIKRRSLRLKRKEEEVVIIGSPEPKEEQQTNTSNAAPDLGLTLPGLLWTEKYQPEHSSEVVGNSGIIKKLKSWLLEWKHRVDKEARKARMLLMKQKKKEKDFVAEDDWWADDSSDFDMDSDDSDDDEDSRLCNTVMLVGPNGIGKTATVYALAQELGFKVFEVNASSSRNGKRILSQLQEATQSHQVSHNKEHNVVGTPKKSLLLGLNSKNKDTVEKKLPTSFANLFKKAESSKKVASEKVSTTPSKSKKRKRKDENVLEEKTPKKKRSRKDEKVDREAKPTDKSSDVGGNKSLNLTSTSLILFEELDIVFEEDKGFWAAVQHFMSTTKIPIILTTNDSSLSHNFEGRYEQHIFKTPSFNSSTTYLQLICLVENVRTDSKEINELIHLNKGDIRKTLLSLQYLLESGGGVKQTKRQITFTDRATPTSQLAIDENTCSQDSQDLVRSARIGNETQVSLLNNDDDEDDFVSLKPVCKSARRLISDDENSCSGFPSNINQKSAFSTDCQTEQSTCATSEKNLDVIPAENLPLVHVSFLSTLFGSDLGHCDSVVQLLDNFVKNNTDEQLSVTVQACQQYMQLKYNVLYNNHLELLPLPKVDVQERIKLEQPNKNNKKRKRIKQTFDLYDSEASNDASQDETPEGVDQTTIECRTTASHKDDIPTAQSLSSFAEFYDSLSFTDSLRTFCNGSESELCSEKFSTVRTGLSDKMLKFEHSKDNSHLDTNSLCTELQLRSLRKLCKSQTEILKIENIDIEKFNVPRLKGNGILSDTPSVRTTEKVTSNVSSNLPLSVYCQKRPITLDYMSSLRIISKTEQIRQQAKAKRRFHHYFDNIGLCLRESTLNILCQPLQ